MTSNVRSLATARNRRAACEIAALLESDADRYEALIRAWDCELAYTRFRRYRGSRIPVSAMSLMGVPF